MTAEEVRIRGVVLEVLQDALRTRGLRGVIVSAPPSPEGELLSRWLQGVVDLEYPSRDRVAAAAAVLGGDRETAWAATAASAARQESLLPVHPAGKVRILLEPLPCVPCYPLGDLWSRDLRTFAGSVTLPGVLAGLPEAEAEAVEEALRRGLDGGAGVSTALQCLAPTTAEAVERALLAAGRSLARPPLVPKTGAWTLGLDPAP